MCTQSSPVSALDFCGVDRGALRREGADAREMDKIIADSHAGALLEHVAEKIEDGEADAEVEARLKAMFADEMRSFGEMRDLDDARQIEAAVDPRDTEPDPRFVRAVLALDASAAANARFQLVARADAAVNAGGAIAAASTGVHTVILRAAVSAARIDALVRAALHAPHLAAMARVARAGRVAADASGTWRSVSLA